METQNPTPQPPAESRKVIQDLFLNHAQDAIPLVVSTVKRASAVECLRKIWLDPDARRGHYAIVAEIFPEARAVAKLLSAEREVEITQTGPDALTNEELAQVLLCSRAVANLDRLAHELVPTWWMNEMAEIGRELASKLNIHLSSK